tara:strand:+ start:122 stop:748 length:627 start_codon:yes stop_codon:yes gene_type:complete
MIQNLYKFNQSSVELEILGLPDYSKDDNDNIISIISNWKLNIIDQPTIEGGIDHLKNILKAFYKYISLILVDRHEKVETKLIDISLDNDGLHKVVLKSTKTGVKPLTIKIGNAELTDIINCFDQLNNSEDVRLDFKEFLPRFNKQKFKFHSKKNILNIILPPVIASFTISIVSIFLILFYETGNEQNKKQTFDLKNNINSNYQLVIKI